MTKQMLEGFNALESEIQELEESIQIERKKAVKDDAVEGSSPEHPYTKHMIPIHGLDSDPIPDKVVSKLTELKKRRQDELWQILDWVDKIDDCIVRRAVRLYYTSGKKRTWQWVATKMQRPMDTETIKKAVMRYIRKSCPDCPD